MCDSLEVRCVCRETRRQLVSWFSWNRRANQMDHGRWMRRVRRVLKVDMERATSRLRVRSVARARVEDEDRLWGLLCAVLDGAAEINNTNAHNVWTSGPRLVPVCRLIALSFSLTSTDKYSRTALPFRTGTVRLRTRPQSRCRTPPRRGLAMGPVSPHRHTPRCR